MVEGEKLVFGTYSNLNFVNPTVLEILSPNGRGKIEGEKLGFGTCSNLNLGNPTV